LKELHITPYKLKKHNYKSRLRKKKRLERDATKFVQAAHFPSSDIIQAARMFDPVLTKET